MLTDITLFAILYLSYVVPGIIARYQSLTEEVQL